MLSIVFLGCSKKEDISVVQKYNEYISQFNFNEAREFLSGTLGKNSDDYDALQLLAELDRYLYHDYTNAETLIKKAIRLKPEDWMNYRILGDIYIDKKNYEEAINSYKKSLEVNELYKESFWDNNISNIYFSIGNCYFGIGDRDKMMDYYILASQFNPYNLKLNATLHKLYVENEEYDKAYEVWRRDNLLDSGIKPIGNYGNWDVQYNDILNDKS